MRNGRFVRKLAGFLAALTLLQCGAPLTALAAEQESDQSVVEVQQNTQVQLQDGTAIIPEGASEAEVKQALFEALVSNKDELGADFNPLSLNWEYECEGREKTAFGTPGLRTNTTWGSVDGFTSETGGDSWKDPITVYYTHPALKDQKDGNTYQIRLVGTEKEVEVTKTSGLESSINLKEGPFTVPLTLNQDGTVNYEDLRAAIFEAVVAGTTPALTVDGVTIQYQYGETITGDAKWGELEGYKGGTMGVGNYDPVGEGDYTLLISYAGGDGYLPTSTQVDVTFTKELETPVLTLAVGTVGLHGGNDWNAVREDILELVTVDSQALTLTTENTTIEYYNEGLEIPVIGSLGAKWVPLKGEGYYPAVQDNQSYKVRVTFNGSNVYNRATSNEATVRFASKADSSIVLKADQTVALPYNEDAKIDFDALRQSIFNTVVDTGNSTPALTVGDVTIEYYAENVVLGKPGGTYAWMPLEGGTSDVREFPAISEGSQQIRISYAGTETVYGTSAETTVTITGRPEAPYTLKATPDAVTLAVGDDMKVDYELLHDAIFNAVVASSDILTTDNVTVEYYYNGVTELDSKWLPLEGQAVVGSVGYPAISAGEKKIRISWPGNQQYAPTTIEATITVKDREKVQFNLNEGPYEVGMKFTDDQAYDYSVTALAIYNTVVASTTPAVEFDDVTLEFSKTGLNFEPLDQTNFLTSFGVGTWKIRISVADTKEYRGNSITVDVTTTDNRLVSNVALKEGVSFTYNMDVNAMKQAIFDNAIDWENSTLPAKENLSIDNFTIEYKAKLTDAETGLNVDLGGLLEKFPGLGNIINNDTLTQWVPIEGKVYSIGGTVLGQFPQMGAGENQLIRISYNGNAEYRPSDFSEGTVTVNKAKVSVKVNSTNIYADEALPENFITLNPNDKFDLYTIYAGVTSNVTTGIYLDLPARYTDNSLIIKAIDGVLEGLGQKTLTQMMNEGITVGELRALFNTQGVLDALEALGINTGTFGQILTVINKLPGILDSVRIAFGTPNNRAGLYTVGVITDSKNYETGVGIGFLLVKMRLSGANLTWNKTISGGKLTAEEAKTFDFGATLSYNGDVTVDQSGVHYLYSGFTSKWKIYSSTTTPPTEPGRYVVTVCILGGNYMAAPITRSFQITK